MECHVCYYRNFTYFLYQPNSRVYPKWFEFCVEPDTDDVTYPYDSLMSLYNGKKRNTKEEAEQLAKKLIDTYYAKTPAGKRIKEMFDMTIE